MFEISTEMNCNNRKINDCMTFCVVFFLTQKSQNYGNREAIKKLSPVGSASSADSA